MSRSLPEFDPQLAAWLEEGPSGGPTEALSSTLARVRTTHQDRVRRRIPLPMRFLTMSSPVKLAAAATIALAVGIAVIPRAPTTYQGAVDPSASPTPSPAPLRQGPLPAGDYTVTPFVGDDLAPCGQGESPCPEAGIDDAISFTFTLPDGWAGAPGGSDIWLSNQHNSGPAGAGFLIGRGGWLWSDPCAETGNADIPVGPSVADFVDALVAHPLLDLSDPVDVSLGGYTGMYVEIQGPADRTDCQYFQAWEPTFYAQGDSNHQPIWVIDVDGVRVVIHGSEFPGTAPERSAELRAIVGSMRIDLAPSPSAAAATPSSAPVVHGFPGARDNPAGLYSWTPGSWGWMHREGGISMTFGLLDDERGALAEVAPPPAELGRRITERPERVADLRIQSWVLRTGSDDVVITITSGPDTPPAVVAEAEAIIESIRVKPTETDPGFRIVFALEDGWDSG